jgi:hypothetical protein
MENKKTLEETAKRLYEYQSQNPPYTIITPKDKIEGFIDGAKWQAEKMYSEEEVLKLLLDSEEYTSRFNGRTDLKKWFKFKKK